jgi:hypothetical protein
LQAKESPGRNRGDLVNGLLSLPSETATEERARKAHSGSEQSKQG